MKKHNIKTLAFFSTSIILVSLTVFSIGCVKKEEGEIKIGVILELTGPLAPQGERSKRSMDLAVDEINSKGWIYGKKIKLILEDTRTDPKEGLSAFQKIVEIHKVPVVTGAIGSSIVMACAPIANQKRVVLFSAGATSPVITNAGDYVFRNRLSGDVEVKAMAGFANSKLKIKKVAVIYVTTDYGTGNKDVFEKAFVDHGGNVVLSEGFNQGESDFRSYITKIKASNTEAVYIIAHSIETAHFLRQAKELNLNTHFLGTIGVKSPDLLKIAGDAANGVIYTVQRFDPESSEKSKTFATKYKEIYGEEPDLFAALGYDAICIITRVISENGYNAEAIKTGLYKLKNFQGVTGNVSFDQNGDIEGEVMMEIVKDCKFLPYQ